ncbi:sulfotransferase family 2 domain-containing protein [Rubinisphaera italica]|uniref:Sulfotransferase family protein n=1 Tax=Rubinisphaera italica TaxID=2527969 RepID=A0A5C5X905_9PLAN|nr:sulfotransferase family 2 domain-containing protein [Rubinisphaera italica]TWT59607.1 hypothetical protein Pan54_03150 [Rubinisphaera italica]
MLAFVHIEKTAGSTMVSILRKSFGIHHADVRSWETPWNSEVSNFTSSDLRKTKRVYCNLQSIAGHSLKPYIISREDEPSIRYFTFFRDPLKRCASHYQYQIQKMHKIVSFDEWISNEEYRNFQCRRLCGQESAERAIEVLKNQIEFAGIVEQFDASLVLMNKLYPLLDIHYSPRNVAEDNFIKNNILNSTRERRMLEEANKEDGILYSYVEKEVFPRQVKQYGEAFSMDVHNFQEQNKTSDKLREGLMPLVIRHLLFRPVMSAYRLQKRVLVKR